MVVKELIEVGVTVSYEVQYLSKPVVALSDWEIGYIYVEEDAEVTILGGKVYGHPEWDNGQPVLTSAVLSMHRDEVETVFYVYRLIGEDKEADYFDKG